MQTNRNVSESIIDYSEISRKRMFRSVVSILIFAVVFITTYVLIIPAITMERETICGMEEHRHVGSCYERVQVCESTQFHMHTRNCYEKVLVCDEKEHVHKDSCYADEEEVFVEEIETEDEESEVQNALMAAPPLMAGRYYYTVWFDGTNGTSGDKNSYYAGATNTSVRAERSSDYTVTTPTSAGTTSKYKYTLRGWYDITNNKYYGLGETVTIDKDTVFYADWIAADYNASSANNVANMDNSEFIKNDIFDYNDLFNMYSVIGSNSVDDNGHAEQWSLIDSGTAQSGEESENFVFFDTKHKNANNILCVAGRNENNSNRQTENGAAYYDGTITEGIANSDILTKLFSTDDDTLGKYYVGSDSYLYQYDDNSGYYYYDSTKNAAAYNQKAGRFYLYPYLVMTSKSAKDGENGSDLLPFNYGTAGASFSDTNGSTNYWFGMKSQINFYLPNDSGVKDSSGKYGNQSEHGTDMVFKFAGDDDVWVFVDDELVLDLGGVHDICYGEINFSTGEIKTGHDGAVIDKSQIGGIGVSGNNGVTTTNMDFSAGDHKITVCYLERGASQSNCAVYFNVAPRYNLHINKKDSASKKKLTGAVFAIFNDKECTNPTTLYESKAAYDKNKTAAATNIFTVGESGTMSCWGLEAGKSYYIKEIQSPEGYKNCFNTVIQLSMNNDGSLNHSIYNGSENFTADFDRDAKSHTITFTVLNEENTDKTTEIKVDKKWFDYEGNDVTDSIDKDSIQFYLYKHITKHSSAETVKITWNVQDAYSQGQNFTAAVEEVPKGSTVKLKLDYLTNNPYQQGKTLHPTILINGKTIGTWRTSGYTERNGVITIDNQYTADSDLTVTLKNCDQSNLWMLQDSKAISCCEILSSPTVQPDSSETEVEKMGPYTISASDGWHWSNDDLPLYMTDDKGNKIESYTYTIGEDEVQYYRTEYENNEGIKSGKITIKNTETERPEYVLPKTGGSGALPYTIGGLILMAAAACLLNVQIGSKEEASCNE